MTEQEYYKRCSRRVYLSALALVTALMVLCSSCKSSATAVVERVRTDTLLITKHQRDSIYLHDSISVVEKQKGDTVFLQLERWHTKYIERIAHDTLYQSKTDSIPVPYPVVQEVNHLYGWQKSLIWVGACALLAILLFAGFRIYKLFH